MIDAGIKEEFDMYVQNAGLTDFISDKCPQYHDLTNSFVRKFEYVSHHFSQNVMFNLYENSYCISIEEFYTACRIPFWGTCLEPHKSDCNEYLMSITRGETRGIT